MSAMKFTTEHEWIRLDGTTAVVGISDYAQEQLGDVVYVELPDVGKKFSVGDNVGVVESVKAVGEIYMPLAGTIDATNERLEDEPELVNTAPTGDGWLFSIALEKGTDVDGLMDEAQYAEFISKL
ncbi:MAG: glycine cleavage system H protein [Gammaproteobacteria bacterium]|jgi:glycine cleavage system H protein